MGYIVRSRAAYLNHNRVNRRLNANRDNRADNASRMIPSCILGSTILVMECTHMAYTPLDHELMINAFGIRAYLDLYLRGDPFRNGMRHIVMHEMGHIETDQAPHYSNFLLDVIPRLTGCSVAETAELRHFMADLKNAGTLKDAYALHTDGRANGRTPAEIIGFAIGTVRKSLKMEHEAVAVLYALGKLGYQSLVDANTVSLIAGLMFSNEGPSIYDSAEIKKLILMNLYDIGAYSWRNEGFLERASAFYPEARELSSQAEVPSVREMVEDMYSGARAAWELTAARQ